LRRVPKPEIDRRVTAIAAELQLDSVLERRPKALSGGQRQRVALGRAMAADPSIFLFDEPLSNLDAPLRASMRAEIVARQKLVRKTTLYVTHDQAEALTMADRVIVLNHGKILGIGPPEQLYRDPPNRFVATFLGRPAMNLIPGQIHTNGESYSIDPPGWNLSGECLAGQGIADGQPILAGVRAEHLRFVAAGAGPSGQIQNREFLGDKILYYISLGPNTVSLLAEPTDQRDLNADVCIAPDDGHVLFFDPANGQRLA
jgi:ABC-type sugar transport system ATPase subunit